MVKIFEHESNDVVGYCGWNKMIWKNLKVQAKEGGVYTNGMIGVMKSSLHKAVAKKVFPWKRNDYFFWRNRNHYEFKALSYAGEVGVEVLRLTDFLVPKAQMGRPAYSKNQV